MATKNEINDVFAKLQLAAPGSIGVIEIMSLVASLDVVVMYLPGNVVRFVKHPHPQSYGEVIYKTEHHFGPFFGGSQHHDIEARIELYRMAVQIVDAMLSGAAPR